MKRGPWHQCGDKSQKLVAEVLEAGIGVGAILSQRDLGFMTAAKYSEQYRDQGAEILADQQFYIPSFSNEHTKTYPTNKYRVAVSKLAKLDKRQLADLRIQLRVVNRTLHSSAVLAPAVVYEAGRPDLTKLNEDLFAVAKEVGDELGVPTYATVVLGHSVTTSQMTIKQILSEATKLNSEGWYFGFEFTENRIPSSQDSVYRFCESTLALACTGKPVLNAFAGPMAILSLGCGGTAAAIGHSQNVWQFARDRWNKDRKEGGGGDAPPRFFSTALWGTIIYPDETAVLSTSLRAQTITSSRFSRGVRSNLPFKRWDSNKHLVAAICSTVSKIAETDNPRASANAAISVLLEAERLHARIAATGVQLKDATSAYQRNWRLALESLLKKHPQDFEYLELLSSA